jgi:hypothetical protein
VPGTYEIYLTTDTGLRIALLDNILGLTAARAACAIAPFRLDLPPSFDTSLIVPDRQVQVWRAPEGGRLSLWRSYFVRKWRYETRGSDQSLTISGPDVNDLLRRRIVAFYAASAEASKTDYADDMMKDIVRESITDSNPGTTAGDRTDWSSYFTIAGDLSHGPTLTKAFAWETLLTSNGGGVLSAIAKAAKEAGTEVFFDIVPNIVSSTRITFQFRTYTGQPGADRTGLGAVFDQARGNLEDPFLEYDYTEEITYVYAGGQGEDADRNIQQVSDATRFNASAWNRCEAFADARMQATNNGVREAGRALLQEGRPRRRFGGTPVNTAGFRFGRDWDFGDKVRARYRSVEFDAIVRAVTISLDGDGREKIQARLDYED